MIIEKTNSRLTVDVSSLLYDVNALETTSPSLLTFEPSVGTVANNLDSYIDSTTSRLFLNIDSSWVSFDVSIL